MASVARNESAQQSRRSRPVPQAAPEPNRNVLVRRRVSIMLVTATVLGVALFFQPHLPHSPLQLSDPMTVGGLCLIALGLAFRSWAASILNKSRTLAMQGPYSCCRHPLYLGSFLMLLGFLLLIDSWWANGVLLTVLFLTYPGTIAYEEQRMLQLFGDVWTNYSARVGRFLPRWPSNLGPISGRTWLANGEYQAVLASIVGLMGLEAWGHIARAFLMG